MSGLARRGSGDLTDCSTSGCGRCPCGAALRCRLGLARRGADPGRRVPGRQHRGDPGRAARDRPREGHRDHVADGILRIKAGRRIEDKTEDKGNVRRELRYGSLARSLPTPDGVSDSDIAATYRSGVLEIRVPVAEQSAAAEPTKIAITKS